MNRQSRSTILMLMTSFGLSIAPSMASGPENLSHHTPQAGAWSEPAQQPLSSRISLANLPDYPGAAKFVDGTVYSKDGSARSYVITFDTLETKEQGYAWYVQALNMYGWTISYANTNSLIQAQHAQGHRCYINIASVSPQGARARFTIYFTPSAR